MSDNEMFGDNDHPAEAIIAAFGGIRPMAAKLGAPVSTVQGWKQRDTIPAARMSDIRKVAAENDIQLPGPQNGAVIDETAIILPDGSADAEKPDNNAADDNAAATPQNDKIGSRAETGTAGSGSEASPARSEAASSGGGWSGGIAVLALLIALGAAGWVWWSTQGPGSGGAAGDENARLSALEGQIARLSENAGDPGQAARDALATRVEALRAEVKAFAVPDVSAALEPVRDEIGQLREQIAVVEASAGSATGPALDVRLAELEAGLQALSRDVADDQQARTDALADIEARIGALDTRFSGLQQEGARQEAVAIDAIALTLAASQLRRDIERGRPFRDALTTLESVSTGDGELDALAARLGQNADTGVASLEELVFSFDETAVQMLDNAPADADNTIVDQILDRARRVVRIRRVGTDVPPESVDGRIARAEFRLIEGDVAGAVGVLQELEGGAAAAAGPWVERAQAHVAAAAALETVETLALARLRAASGS